MRKVACSLHGLQNGPRNQASVEALNRTEQQEVVALPVPSSLKHCLESKIATIMLISSFGYLRAKLKVVNHYHAIGYRSNLSEVQKCAMRELRKLIRLKDLDYPLVIRSENLQ